MCPFVQIYVQVHTLVGPNFSRQIKQRKRISKTCYTTLFTCFNYHFITFDGCLQYTQVSDHENHGISFWQMWKSCPFCIGGRFKTDFNEDISYKVKDVNILVKYIFSPYSQSCKLQWIQKMASGGMRGWK